MKKKIIILILTLSTFFSVGQFITTFSMASFSCLPNPPTDTLKYSCSDDTLYVMLRQVGQPCFPLWTTMQIVADTLKISVVDTNMFLCWETCMQHIKFRIWGLLPKYYIGKHLGIYYPIYCWSTVIQSHEQFPPFVIKDNKLSIDFYKPAQFRLSDINGRLLLSTKEREIDLKPLNLNSGLYFISIDSESYSGHRKILIE